MIQKLVKMACVTLAAVIYIAPASAETLQNPEDGVLDLLGRKLAGHVLNFEDLATGSQAVRSANEFAKKDAVEAEVQRLQSIYASFNDETQLQYNVNGTLGNFDADRGGFPIDLFNPGVVINTQPAIAFSNASEVVILPADASTGPEIVEKIGEFRRVTLVVTLDDLKISPLNPERIEGRVATVDIMSENGIDKIASITAPEPEAPIESGVDAYDGQQLLLSAFGLPIPGDKLNVVAEFLAKQPAARIRTPLDGGSKTPTWVAGIRQDESEDVMPTGYDRDSADFIIAAYGPDMKALKNIFDFSVQNASGRRPFSLTDNPNINALGENVNCWTRDTVDSCGVMIFNRDVDDDWALSEVLHAQYVPMSYQSADIASVFGEGTLANMSRMEALTAFSASALGSKSSNGRANAMLYTLGPIKNTAPVLMDPLAGNKTTISAQTMLFLIDGGTEATLSIVKASAAQ